MPNSLPLSYTFDIPFQKKELKQHNKSKTSSNLREPLVELIKSLISLVGSWASNSSNWLMIASTTKSSMLLLRNTILSLSNSPITSPSMPLVVVEGVWGIKSLKVRPKFQNWDPKFGFLEGIGTHLVGGFGGFRGEERGGNEELRVWKKHWF